MLQPKRFKEDASKFDLVKRIGAVVRKLGGGSVGIFKASVTANTVELFKWIDLQIGAYNSHRKQFWPDKNNVQSVANEIMQSESTTWHQCQCGALSGLIKAYEYFLEHERCFK